MCGEDQAKVQDSDTSDSGDQAMPDANQKETSSGEGMEEENTGEEEEQAATDDNEEATKEAASGGEQVVTGDGGQVEATALQESRGHRGTREQNAPNFYNPAVNFLQAIQPFRKTWWTPEMSQPLERLSEVTSA
jgi:hypothetical protein